MKKIILALLAASAAISLGACTQVQPGHVGIKVNQYGSGRGAEPVSLSTGTYFAGPGIHIYEYPVYTKTYTFTGSDKEGNKNNEEFSFQDAQGLTLNGDVAVSYHVDQGKATVMFTTYREDMDTIVETQLRNEIRNALEELDSVMQASDIYGPKKKELMDQVQTDVQRYFSPKGLDIDQVYWAGAVRLPPTVMTQINQRIANENMALAAQANVATAEANGRAKIAAATAEAQANDLIGKSLQSNPGLIEMTKAQRWDGKLPQTQLSSASPFINVK